MKTLCIYHGNCFDGMAGAWVVSRLYPNAIFHPATFEQKVQDIYKEYNIVHGDRVTIVDFSFKREDLIWASGVGDLIVLDHHKTAQANCEGLNFCIFDMNESGASLAWKYYFPNTELPILIRYIKDRDLWLFKERFSEDINAYIQSYPMTIEMYEELNYEFENDNYKLETAYQAGKAINRYKNQMVDNICKTAAFEGDPHFKDYGLVPVVNTSLLFSEVGHQLCKLWPEAPFAVYYYDRLNANVRQYGLRSIGDFDVSEVAKRYGGGGHKNAAGFEMSLSAL